MLRISLIFERSRKNRFDIFNPPSHRHVLIQYFEGFHYPQFPIFQLLVCYRIADIAQFIRIPMIILHLFVPTYTAILPTWMTIWSLALQRLTFLQRRLLMWILDLHKVEQMLGIWFSLKPELVFFHHLKKCSKRISIISATKLFTYIYLIWNYHLSMMFEQ